MGLLSTKTNLMKLLPSDTQNFGLSLHLRILVRAVQVQIYFQLDSCAIVGWWYECIRIYGLG